MAPWAVQRGLLAPRAVDPIAELAEEMAKALREEYRTDPVTGLRHRVNYSARITKDAVQGMFWGDLRAPRSFMVKHFAQRRKQIVDDCVQVKADVLVYNANHADAAPIQMVLDFTVDVAERLAVMDRSAAPVC